MEEHNLLVNTLYYLGAAVLMVPMAARVGLGSVLGYLLAGIVIGPWGLKLVTDPEAILHFAEFGVVLLLFLIGLEISPRSLMEMRKPILGLGGGQLLLTTLLLTPLLHLVGLGWGVSLIGALALSLSSTAIALAILKERNLMPTQAGKQGFAILLFQDLAVIPILAFMPLISGQMEMDGAQSLIAAAQALGVIGAIFLAGHFAVPWALRVIAKTGISELFTAFALLLVIGISALMAMVDLSMALGAFMAGLLLADSEYRHALEGVIDPFKGLLMGLFFMAVGMSVDFGLLMAEPLRILLTVALLVLAKILVLYGLARWWRLPHRQQPFFTLLLSQGGEFGFVVLSLAVSEQAMAANEAQFLVLVVALSMMSTPLLLALSQKFIEPRFARVNHGPDEEIEAEGGHVIVAGFGRYGQIVGRLLHAQGIPVTLQDHNPDHIERTRRFGFKVFFGDAGRLDLLHAAGADEARLLVIAIDDREKALAMVELVRTHFPRLKVVARAWDMMHLFEYRDRGVTAACRETFESAMQAAGFALRALDFDESRVTEAIALFREHDREVIEHMYEVHLQGEQALAQTSIELRDKLNELYKGRSG